MMVLSLKCSKKKMLLFAGAVVCLVGAIMAIGSINRSGGAVTVENASPQSIAIKGVKLKTNEERIAFLEQFGWLVETEAVEVMEVMIPKEFDEVYTQYNSIQLQQGLDLSSYSGKKVKRYTYSISNYPDYPQNVHADILVYKGQIIAGDICCTNLAGFMHGLNLPSAKTI